MHVYAWNVEATYLPEGCGKGYAVANRPVL